MLNNHLIKIKISFLNALLASIALWLGNNYSLISPLAFTSIILFGTLCLFELSNILFLSRTFFLGLIGYFPIFVKIVFGEDKLFSGYEHSTQTFDITVVMYIVTSYALFSNALGFYFGSIKGQKSDNTHFKAFIRESRKRYWQVGFFLSIPIVIWAGHSFARTYGETIFNAAYTTMQSSGLTFGSTGVIGIIGLFIIFIAGIKGYVKRWKIIFLPLALYFIIYSQLLFGLRQDAITATFGIFILYGISNQTSLKLKFKWLPWLILAYFSMEVWGVLRSTWNSGMSFSSFFGVIPSMFKSKIINFGTVSPIATTFSNTVWLIDSGKLDLAWGRTYFEYLLRTPPAFIYPNRPADYAFIFQKYHLVAGGGFFELAEVYMNFGIAGALLIPGLISYFLAKSYYFAFKRQSMFSYFILFTFLSVFLRGTWYQTFAFYRAFLVSMLIYLTIVWCKQFIFQRKPKSILAEK